MDSDPDRTVAISLDFLTPERTVQVLALAAIHVAEGVQVEFPHERMADEYPRQIVVDLEAVRAGGDERFRQPVLPDHGHVEAVLEIIFLAHRVRDGLAILVERPAKNPRQEGPLRDARLCWATFPFAMALDHRHDLAAVVDIGEPLTRKPLVSLGG